MNGDILSDVNHCEAGRDFFVADSVVDSVDGEWSIQVPENRFAGKLLGALGLTGVIRGLNVAFEASSVRKARDAFIGDLDQALGPDAVSDTALQLIEIGGTTAATAGTILFAGAAAMHSGLRINLGT